MSVLLLDVRTCSPYVLHVHHNVVYNSFTLYEYFDTEIASDSISEHLFFKIFLRGHAPSPLALACVDCASHNAV